MKRVVVVGGPGAGKTTVAAALAELLAIDHIELDSLWWQPGWAPAGRETLRAALAARITREGWVADGNYIDEVADLVWPAADAIVWLDPPRHRAVRRAVIRALRRITTRVRLWNGNRESWSVLAPHRLARLVKRWPSYSSRIAERLDLLDLGTTEVVRLCSDQQTAAWLAGVRRDERRATSPA